MSELHDRVPLASTPQSPFEDLSVMVPAAEPTAGRKVAQVCYIQPVRMSL